MPPPPPPAPPPPPVGLPFAGKILAPSKGAPDRSALLSDIRGGARLKKAVTNDRSAPLVDAGKTAPNKNSSSNGNSSSSGPPGLGGLFAQGMPKLRSTGSKLVASSDSNDQSNSSSLNSRNYAGNDRSVTRAGNMTSSSSLSQKSPSASSIGSSNIKASLEQQFASINLSNKHSPEKPSIQYPSSPSNNNPTKYNTIHSSKVNRRSSNDSSLSNNETHNKGRAPSVPTSSSNNPPLPAKPGVNRSHSQTSGQRPPVRSHRPGPPSSKPPPPPKVNGSNPPAKSTAGATIVSINSNRTSTVSSMGSTVTVNGSTPTNTVTTTSGSGMSAWHQPPLPNKLPNQLHVGQQESRQTRLLSPGDEPPPLPKTSPPPLNSPTSGAASCPSPPKPPPPPRNMSNGLTLNNKTSPAPQPGNKSVNSLVGASLNTSQRSQSISSTSLSSNPGRPAAPPPPPPSSTNRISNTNHQLPSHPAPQPPSSASSGVSSLSSTPRSNTRNTSISRVDLESRFGMMFKDPVTLPIPDRMTKNNKMYPSQQNQKRCPPPPPCVVSNLSHAASNVSYTSSSSHLHSFNNNSVHLGDERRGSTTSLKQNSRASSSPMLHIQFCQPTSVSNMSSHY